MPCWALIFPRYSCILLCGLTLYYFECSEHSRELFGSHAPYFTVIFFIESFLQLCFEGKWLQNRLLADECELRSLSAVNIQGHQLGGRLNFSHFILFVRKCFSLRCYSHVGRTGGKQKLSLGFECFYHGISLHEIGHALGLYHEQSRPDRDEFVEIVWSNIKEG